MSEQNTTVPPGWKLVPVEPTEAMLTDMHDAVRILCEPDYLSATITNDRDVWAVMLAAAPEPPNAD